MQWKKKIVKKMNKWQKQGKKIIRSNEWMNERKNDIRANGWGKWNGRMNSERMKELWKHKRMREIINRVCKGWKEWMIKMKKWEKKRVKQWAQKMNHKILREWGKKQKNGQ